MKNQDIILLPGLSQQAKFLLSKINIDDFNILIIGANQEQIAKKFSAKTENKIEIIVEEYESLINSKLILEKENNIQVKIMSFEHTDFNEAQFDLVFAQASISNLGRKSIVKEVKRILKPNGIFCVGEIVKLKTDVPVFMQDIFDASELEPLELGDLEKYYTDRNFELIDSKDLSGTLNEFYTTVKEMRKGKIGELSEGEKSYYKKTLNKMNHESNIFIKLGGDKFIGFKTLILKKK